MKNEGENYRLETTGVLLAIAGAIMFSAKAVIIKLAYGFEVSTVTLLMLRMVIALPFFVAVGIWRSKKQRGVKDSTIHKRDYFFVILLGLLGYYLASFLDFMGLQYITASMERLILFVYPTMVVFLSAIFLKKKITMPQLTAILITYIGMFVTFSEQLNFDHYQGMWIGAGLIFLSALTYSFYLVGSSQVMKRLGSVQFTTLAMIASCGGVLLHFGIEQGFGGVFDLPDQVYIYSFLMAIFCTVLPSYMISESINRIGASNMSIIASVGPVSTISLSTIFLNEQLTLIQFIGALIVIFGVWRVGNAKVKKSSLSGATS